MIVSTFKEPCPPNCSRRIMVKAAKQYQESCIPLVCNLAFQFARVTNATCVQKPHLYTDSNGFNALVSSRIEQNQA